MLISELKLDKFVYLLENLLILHVHEALSRCRLLKEMVAMSSSSKENSLRLQHFAFTEFATNRSRIQNHWEAFDKPDEQAPNSYRRVTARQRQGKEGECAGQNASHARVSRKLSP